MATIKSYSDLQQSKKLAEILPLESADMHYSKDFDGRWFVDLAEYTSVKIPKYVGNVEKHLLPCWSLASLLNVLPKEYTNSKNQVCLLHIDIEDSEKPYLIWYANPEHEGSIVEIKTEEYSNLVDACYEMVIKLHEQNII